MPLLNFSGFPGSSDSKESTCLVKTWISKTLFQAEITFLTRAQLLSRRRREVWEPHLALKLLCKSTVFHFYTYLSL